MKLKKQEQGALEKRNASAKGKPRKKKGGAEKSSNRGTRFIDTQVKRKKRKTGGTALERTKKQKRGTECQDVRSGDRFPDLDRFARGTGIKGGHQRL